MHSMYTQTNPGGGGRGGSLWLTLCTVMQTQKQIRILENRLEKMYHKYNESKSRNQVRG